MKEAILRVYDILSARRWLAALIVVALLALFLFSASRMGYLEDISAFLPHDEQAEKYASVYEQLGGQDKVAVFFECAEGEDPADATDCITEAMDCFGDHWADCDSLGWVPDLQVTQDGGQVRDVFNFIRAGMPYFLEASDYARMDSLLAVPGYVGSRLDDVKASLYSPGSGFSTAWLQSDPLDLFSPVLTRLGGLNPASGNRLEDGYLFTPDGKAGVVFFNSPFGGSETDRNGELAKVLEKAVSRTVADCPGIRVFSTGGPLVAVGNASRIKKDSLLAVAIALLLIALVLWLSFRRFSDVLWIGITILFGAAFALGVIALLKPAVSIIVLGIGSMIIGIAVNYPLHYVDHLKYQKDKRKTLADQINPLLVGNITTVGAFLSLLLLKADALHDFGAIGALTLVGTILFVLLFLPVFVPAAKGERRTIRLDWDRHLNPSRTTRRLVFAGFLILTCIFLLLSRKISFDADMQHINYMTDDQRRGFALLTEMGEDDPSVETVYVVAEGATPEAAVRQNEQLQQHLQSAGGTVASLAAFLPSEETQRARLARWNEFLAAHPTLQEDLWKAKIARGFSPQAFAPFVSLLAQEWTLQPVEWFAPLTRTLGAAMYLPGEGQTRIVSYLKLDKDAAEAGKEALRADLPEGSFCFSTADVGNRLVNALSGDFDKIGFLCGFIVFLFLWLSFRSIELSVMSFLPLAVGWVWILGIMQLLGLQFNIVNIILATFIFGQGDDYTIFITEGLMYEHACGKKILRSYKNCVMLSALIMFIGIGALVVARHPAMRSLAYVTIIGMFTVVVMAYYLPPLVFRWLTRRRDGSFRPVPITLRAILSTAWVGLVFGLTLLFTAIWASIYFLFGDSERKRLRYHKMICWCTRMGLRIIPGARFTMANPHGEDFSKPAVYVCNHQSHLDTLALLALHPKLVFMTNDWAWKFYGPIIRKAEFYPASYGFEKNSIHIKSLMERGYSVAVFPEGTRSEDCEVHRFHRGAFLAAKDLGLDILPVYIHGFGYALPKRTALLRKADLYLEVGRRIPAASIPDDVKGFVRAYRHEFAAEYDRIRGERETAAYIAPYVRYQYLYKGEDAMRECSATLVRRTFAEIDAVGDTVRTICVTGSGCGVYALLLALRHRDKEIHAYEADEEKYLTAVRCQAVPGNLHYHWDAETPERVSADLVIER